MRNENFRWRLLVPASCIFLAFFLTHCVAKAQKPHKAHPGKGAMSAIEIAHQPSLDFIGSDDANKVCDRKQPGSIVLDPPELSSVNGVLEVSLHLRTVTDEQGLVRYCLVTDTGLESPVLRVNQGDQISLHLFNELPVPSLDAPGYLSSAMAEADVTQIPMCGGTMGMNVTNLHLHGTNVSPGCGQDNVTRTLIPAGQSYNYDFHIPDNEPPGLYWYHPHPHGESEMQVQGGASGVLIVNGIQNTDPALSGLTERTFVLRDQVLPAAESNDPDLPAWDLSINFVPVLYPNYQPAVIRTEAGKKELWRVANNSADSILDLQYLVKGKPQPMTLYGVDGVPIAAGPSGRSSEVKTDILLVPASRAEFVVMAPGIAEKGQLVTREWDTGPDGDNDPVRPIADIVSKRSDDDSVEAHLAAVKRLPESVTMTKPMRFAAMSSAEPSAYRKLYFSEVLSDPNDPNSPTNFYITVEGQEPKLYDFGQPASIVTHAGTVEDWVVENRALEDHVFHIHQIHFQVLQANGKPVNDPALHDSVDLPYWDGTGPYPSVKLRMDFRDPNIVGEFVYHCHILGHEDGGMMAVIQVLPPVSTSSEVAAGSSAAASHENTKR